MQIQDNSYKLSPKQVFRNILVPFDNSKLSDRAFWYAINLNFNHESRIILLSIFHSDSFSRSFLEYNTHQTIIEQKKLNEIKIKHKKLKKMASEYNILCSSIISSSSSISEALISYIFSSKADLVIMGTRGNGNDRKLMLGSVSLEISQKSPVPVMLVK